MDNLIARVCRCGFCQRLQEAGLGDLSDDEGDEEKVEKDADADDDAAVVVVASETTRLGSVGEESSCGRVNGATGHTRRMKTGV